MSFVAAAVGAAAGLGAYGLGASGVTAALIGTGVMGALSSSNAANTQASGQLAAAGTQQNMFNTINQQNQPFIQAGYGSTNTLQQLLGTAGTPGTTVGNTGLQQGYLTSQFNPTQQQLNNYPGYQFALQTGGQAIRNADTPGVGALSGAALKDLMNFNVGTASNYYNQYFNQYQQQQNNIYNRLSGLSSLGQNAATNVGNAGMQLGTGIAGAQAGAAASQAAGQLGAAQSVSNSLVPAMYLSSLANNSGYTTLANGAVLPNNQLGAYAPFMQPASGGGGS